MAKIKKIIENGGIQYPATITDAVKNPNNGKTVTEELSELGSEVFKFCNLALTPSDKLQYIKFVKECYLFGEDVNKNGTYRINFVRKNDAGQWIVRVQDYNDTSKYIECNYKEEKGFIKLDTGTFNATCYMVCDWSYVADGVNATYVYLTKEVYNLSNSPIISAQLQMDETENQMDELSQLIDKKTKDVLTRQSIAVEMISANIANPDNISVGNVADGALNNSDNGWKKIVIPITSDMVGGIFSFGNYNLGRSGNYVFTDENDSYIIDRQFFSNPATINGKTIAAPIGAKKLYIDVKASGYEEDLAKLTVNLGANLNAYEPYQEVVTAINNIPLLSNRTLESLNEESKSLRTTFYNNSYLWDDSRENVTAQTGVDVDRFHTDYIPVIDGYAFEIKTWFGSTKWVSLVAFDGDKKIIPNQCVSGSYNGYVEVSSNVKYIIVSSTRIGVGHSTEFYVKYAEKKHDSHNAVQALKYPMLVTDRACMSFQIDCSQYTCGYEKILNILREYGLMSVDFALNIKSLDKRESPVDTSWFNERQKEGCEIIYHNLIGTHSDFSYNSTLSVEECRNGISDDLDVFKTNGFTTFGVVANEGKLDNRYKSMVDGIFSWSIYQSALILENQSAETSKASWTADHRIHRTGFDMTMNASQELQDEVILKGKMFIDNIINNKSMGVMYCHGINNLEANSRITEYVLRELASYVRTKIYEGKLIWGNTSECLRYMLSK